MHAMVWAAANWLLDAASLWVFIFAFGHAVLPIDLLVAYGLANILAVIPITPGGLGVVEGVLIPTLVGFARAEGDGHPGRAVLAPGQLLAADPASAGVAYLSLRFGPHARAPGAAPPPTGQRPTSGTSDRLGAGHQLQRRKPGSADRPRRRTGRPGDRGARPGGLDLPPAAGPLDGQLLQPPLRV